MSDGDDDDDLGYVGVGEDDCLSDVGVGDDADV